MKRIREHFSGYDCVKLENEALALWVTEDVGPRIIGLRLAGGSNLLAVVPQAQTITPAGNTYHFRGGHRLWNAPEDVEHTYVPDDTAVAISPLPNGVQTSQPVEPGTGLQKQMTITLPDETARVIIDHSITNTGSDTHELAPWAITQLKPGGRAVLPQSSQDTGLLPNRRLAFWPYSRLNSPHLKLGDRFILVEATMTADEKLKLGWPNLDGWLAYWVENTLFVKEAPYQPEAVYFDFGSSSECYCDSRFLELETLGPRSMVGPGKTVSHREKWRIFPNVPFPADETAVTTLFSDLNTSQRIRQSGTPGF